jgi:hypothetical protein
MTKPNTAPNPAIQKILDSDPFAKDANLDLSGFPSLRQLPENDSGEDMFLGADTHLVLENKHSLKKEFSHWRTAGTLKLPNT